MTAPTMPSLACGCNQRRPCSLAALLFRFGEWARVAKHLEEMHDRTSLMTRQRIHAALERGVKLSATLADMKAANRRAAAR